MNSAEAYFRQLLTSPSNEWKRISSSTDGSPSTSKKGKARLTSAAPELSDVVVHRNTKSSGSEDVYRIVLDVPAVEEPVSLEPWKAVLTTPELRREWDPAVDEAHLLEVVDRSTQISKTNFSLGWPAKCVAVVWIYLEMLTLAAHETQSLSQDPSVTPAPSSTSPHLCRAPQTNQHICGPHHPSYDPTSTVSALAAHPQSIR